MGRGEVVVLEKNCGHPPYDVRVEDLSFPCFSKLWRSSWYSRCWEAHFGCCEAAAWHVIAGRRAISLRSILKRLRDYRSPSTIPFI